jgi:hypothetical protein
MKERIETCLAILPMALVFVLANAPPATAIDTNTYQAPTVKMGGQSILAPSDSTIYLTTYHTAATTVRAGFTPYKANLVWGEPLQVTFTVENLGPTNFEFSFGGDYRWTGRPNRFKITVTNSTGAALPDPIAPPMDRALGGLGQQINLKPGQSFTNVVDLTSFRVIDKPGGYKVHCSFAFELWGHAEQTNPVVNSMFTLAILERTPERVARVLDELVAKAQAVHGHDLDETLALMVRFGKEDAVPRLAQLAEAGRIDLRVGAMGALSSLPTDASQDIVLASLKDSDPAIRTAAAGSLGAMQKPRAVAALLDILPKEEFPVAEAVVVSLGATKSDLAFPVITNTLDSEDTELQRAAVKALANFGGSNAIAALTQRIDTNHLSLRYAIVKALAEQLHQPMHVEWLWPVLMEHEQSQKWIDSLSLLRRFAGDQAVPALLSCVDFDVAWSGRNWWIFNQIRNCSQAPRIDYDYDSNSDGTPAQWEKNLRTLQALKPLASPIPILADGPKAPPVPYLKTDPPIDFSTTFKEPNPAEVEIKSGFLSLTLNRVGSTGPYSVSEPYRAVYQNAAEFRSLPRNPERCAALKITPEQMTRLIVLLQRFAMKLCGPDQEIGNCYYNLTSFSNNCPYGIGTSWKQWATYKDYKEAPAGPIRDQVKADLIDSVRVFSQNYHAGTVEFVEAAKKIFTQAQLDQISR